jgi:hypothetical protein
MNTTNVILIGLSFGVFDYIKNTGKIISENLSDFSALEKFLISSFASGELTENTTLVFDLQSKNDFAIKRFFTDIKPTVGNLFHNNWNKFSKKIVFLVSDDSKMNPTLNKLGINGFSREIDVQDYFLMLNI